MSIDRLDDLALVDHHCHGVILNDLSVDGFEGYATESSWGPAPGTTAFDSPFGIAMQRICSPLLDLEPGAGSASYLARRSELGWIEVTRRILAASGVSEFLIETGFPAADIASPEDMATLSGSRVREVVRLEAVAESVAPSTTAAQFMDNFAQELDHRLTTAIAVKTIAAYRFGLDVTSAPPSDTELERSASAWLSAAGETGDYRICDRTLISGLIWHAIDRQAVIQVHTGFGDADAQLDLADPSLLSPLLRATRTSGARFVLLHCYPFIRSAGVLAHVFPHVWFDVSCVSHFAGPSVPTLVREALETAPLGRVLYASDAYALPEHYLVSSQLWRRSLALILDEWVADDWLSVERAHDYAQRIGSDNARSLYYQEAP